MDWAEYLKNSKTYKVAENDDKQPCIIAHGYEWPYTTPLSIELSAYRTNLEGRALFHLKNAHDFIWPQDVKTWNDWTERRFAAHCEGWKVMTWAAGANSGKSYDAGKLGLLFWLANPSARTCLVASTSLGDLDSRIWGYLKRFYGKKAAFDLPGTLTISPPSKILLERDDTVHGIFAVPLQRGSATKTASTLIGRHPDEGLFVVVDEGTDVSPGFMDAIPNWEKSPFFQLIVIGNSSSMYDPHGLLSRPKEGWHTINPDFDTEWETKQGICLYFDCYNSPAIHEKDPEKKKLLGNFLFTEEGIEKAKQDHGENSPRFWRMTRGFWPKEDTLQTVLTAVTIDKFEAQGQAHWAGIGEIHELAGLDPAFSPECDECILRFAKLGIDINGLWTLDYGGEENIFNIEIEADNPEPSEYQILNKAREICEERNVLPENLAVDVWGMGSGLGAILYKNWSPYIYHVSSAGPASDITIDREGKVKASDVYDRRVTELWFAMEKFVSAGQIRGLDDISCEQFCTRQYEWKGKKFSIETKKDYKERLGKVDNRYRSPDRADAAAMILDLARKFYGFIPGQINNNVLNRDTGFRKWISQKIRDGEGPPHQMENSDYSGHPANWGDGFTVSQFDVSENE